MTQSQNNSDGAFLLLGLGLLIISMIFNYTAFASFSSVIWQQACFIAMGLLYDMIKIKLAISTNRFWTQGNHLISFFQFISFWILTFIAIIAGYIFLVNMSSNKSDEKLKESSGYQSALLQVGSTQKVVDGLVQYGSESQKSTKTERLRTIEAKISEYNTTPVTNYYGKPAGTFGSMNRCGQGQSRYNIYCSEVAALNQEKARINQWLDKHESYLSSVAVLNTRKQALYDVSSGTNSVSSAELEPFRTFSRMFSINYLVAMSVSMFFLSILSELLASLCFVSYSTTYVKSSNSVFDRLQTKAKTSWMNAQKERSDKTATNATDKAMNEIETFKNDSFDEPKIVTSGRSKTFSMTDSQYASLTKVITLGISPPTLYSLRKKYGLNAKLITTLQTHWLKSGLIEAYDRGGLTSYRLVKKQETTVISG